MMKEKEFIAIVAKPIIALFGYFLAKMAHVFDWLAWQGNLILMKLSTDPITAKEYTPMIPKEVRSEIGDYLQWLSILVITGYTVYQWANYQRKKRKEAK